MHMYIELCWKELSYFREQGMCQREQTDQRAENGQRPLMGLQQNKIVY